MHAARVTEDGNNTGIRRLLRATMEDVSGERDRNYYTVVA